MASASERLKLRSEFLRVAAAGRKIAVPGSVMQAFFRDDSEPVRVGFTVTKKIGNAVVRNRTRRRLREAARIVLAERPAPGFDLVLVGRAATRKRNFAMLVGDLRQALDRAVKP